MKFLLHKRIMLLAAIIVSALVSLGSSHINSYYLQVIISIGINVVLAVSLNLINGYTGQFSLGHAGFMAIGAYASAYLSTDKGAAILNALGGVSVFSTAALFIVALIVGGALAALAGLIVGVPSLRLKGDYLAIVTLGFGQIIVVLIQNADAVGAARGYGNIPGYTNLFWTFSIAALTIYTVVSLIDSTYGRGFLTVRDDEIAAEAMGIDTTRYKVVAFVLGAFFAGVAGGLYAHSYTYINPSAFDFQLSIQIVVMVILGGMGSTAGVTFAAILLTALLEVLRTISSYIVVPRFLRGFALDHHLVQQAFDKLQEISRNRMIIFSLLLIVLMLTRPQGLFGGLRAFGAGASRKVPKAA